MGGVGSGNWYRFDKKTTTDECHGVDVRYLYRHDLLKPGGRFSLRWSRAGRETGSIRGMVEGNYGVLGMEGIDYLEIRRDDRIVRRDDRMGRRESLSAFWEEVLNAARVLELYEAATASDLSEKNLTETLRAWDFPVEGQSLEQQREFALFFVADRVGAYVSRECRLVLYRTVTDDGKIMGFAQGFGFDSLLGAMYLQMMWLMVEGSEENVRRCERPGCPRIISFEPPQPEDSMKRGARGKYRTRKDKKYCSPACKQWVYDNAKKQASY